MVETKSKKAKSKGGSEMNASMIKLAFEMFKNITDLTKKVTEAGDANSYAESVEKLNVGVSDTYNQMRTIIVNSSEFSDEEKVEKLKELAEGEMNAKRNCSEMIIDNRENVAKIAMEVVKGLLTCGLSFAPAIIKRMKSAIAEKSELPEFELEDFQSVVDVDAVPLND